MNAAFILVTAACLAGGQKQPPPPVPGPAPGPAPHVAPAPHVVPGPVGGGCWGPTYTNNCCDTGGHRFFGGGGGHRLFGGGGGLFGRHGQRNNDCCDTGCAPAPVNNCCTATGHGHGNDCCGGGGGHKLFGGGRLFGGGGGHFRGLFRRNNDCCDPCANGYGTAYPGTYGAQPGGVIVTPPPGGEKIPGPKDAKPLPPGGKKTGTEIPAGIEPPMGNSGTIGIPEPLGNGNLDIIPPAVVPNIPAVPTKSPF